jgi:hypothetical protein
VPFSGLSAARQVRKSSRDILARVAMVMPCPSPQNINLASRLEHSLHFYYHFRPIRLAYQPPDSSTFLSQQTSHQQSASSTFLSQQTSTSH